MYLRPVSSTSWQIFSHSLIVVAIGTVHITCLPALRACDRHPGVIGNRRVDVDEIDLGIGQHVVVFGVARGDAEGVADLVQLRLVPLADGVHVGMRMGLVDRNELGPEPQTDDRHVDLLGHGQFSSGLRML